MIVPDSLIAIVGDALRDRGVEFGEAARFGHRRAGQPRAGAAGEGPRARLGDRRRAGDDRGRGAAGLRSLYVALTRATQRLAVVHAEDLPDALREVVSRPHPDSSSACPAIVGSGRFVDVATRLQATASGSGQPWQIASASSSWCCVGWLRKAATLLTPGAVAFGRLDRVLLGAVFGNLRTSSNLDSARAKRFAADPC